MSRQGRQAWRSAASKAYTDKLNRSEEHTSELQSLTNLVCRLLLEKKKTKDHTRLKQLADAGAERDIVVTNHGMAVFWEPDVTERNTAERRSRQRTDLYLLRKEFV